MDEALREELIAMRAEDLRVREELLNSGELGGGYAPRMEAIHRRNAARLREIIAEYLEWLREYEGWLRGFGERMP